MSDKEMIEEIEKALPHIEVIKTMYSDIDFAKCLYDKDIRVISKDSVVLSKKECEEYQKFKSFMERNDWENVEHIETTLDKCQEVLYERFQQERKKIAENYKISMMLSIQEMQKYLEIDEEQAKLLYYHNAQVAKQFGVGTKE